jgi:8-oxo-(d)GTP phosphatase
MMRLLCAALSAAFLMVTAPSIAAETGATGSNSEHQAFDVLRAGGNVLVIRHAHSPGGQKAPVGMTEGCELAPGRGLDAEGFYQARALGELLREEEVPILKAYTSDMCRAWDTARLIGGGAPVTADPSQKTTDPAVIAAFKQEIEAELRANPGQNIMLVSHSNIAPLYGAIEAPDEEELPQGMISVVRPTGPKKWNGVEGVVVRIRPPVPVSPQADTAQ